MRVLGAILICVILYGVFWLGRVTVPQCTQIREVAAPASASQVAAPASASQVAAPASASQVAAPASASLPVENAGIAQTNFYAHNLSLRKGAHFRIYIRWIRGIMLRTHHEINPSFDAPDSFLLEITKGVLSVRLKDLSDFLNSDHTGSAPLTNVSIRAAGDQVELHGTVHKLIPLPIKITGRLTPLPDGRVQFHVLGLSLLKVPLKGLLGVFHLKLSNITPSNPLTGVEIVGNDVFFDTEKLLPPPHIHGQITAVHISPDKLTVVYGNANDNEERLSQWHNFLRFEGGTLDFGKLTMHAVDLTMIDASSDPWFDLDLVNYQAQLVNGYTRMTAKAGVEIYMPDLDEMSVKKSVSRGITLEWLKNRQSSLPSDVTSTMNKKSTTKNHK